MCERSDGNFGTAQCTFDFSRDAKTLAISGWDGEGGCAMGGLVLTCGGSAFYEPWTAVTSTLGANNTADNKWKALGSDDQRSIRGTDWAQTDFDDSKWAKTVRSTRPRCGKKTADGSLLKTCQVVDDVARYFCAGGLCNDDDDTLHAICADESDSTNFEGGDRTYWWFRFTM